MMDLKIPKTHKRRQMSLDLGKLPISESDDLD